MLTPEDLDNIHTRQQLSNLEMKEAIIEAMGSSFDKHLEKDHEPLIADVKTAQDRISGIKRFLVYCSGFVAGITALVMLALKFG